MISGTYERNGKNRKARLNRKYDDAEGHVGNLRHTVHQNLRLQASSSQATQLSSPHQCRSFSRLPIHSITVSLNLLCIILFIVHSANSLFVTHTGTTRTFPQNPSHLPTRPRRKDYPTVRRPSPRWNRGRVRVRSYLVL